MTSSYRGKEFNFPASAGEKLFLPPFEAILRFIQLGMTGLRDSNRTTRKPGDEQEMKSRDKSWKTRNEVVEKVPQQNSLTES